MFLLLIITSLASIVIYLRTTNDIFALLGVGMALACLIWGLVIVHWSIHIVALLAVLLLVKPKPVSVATVTSRYK